MRMLMIAFMLMVFTIIHGKDNIMLFDNFTLQDGLLTNSILEVVQDTSGFLWLSSDLGVSRFDGETFQNYTHIPQDSFSIPSNLILGLYVSKKGDLWIGTWNGICKYDPVYDRFENYIPNPHLTIGDPLNIVISVAEDKEGRIFFLTEGGYLYNIEDGVIKTKLNLQQGNCKFMMLDNDNQCWISSRNTIFRFNLNSNLTTQFEVEYSPNVKDPEVTDMILIDSLLYISSYNSDLIKYNHYTKKQYNYDLVNELSHTTSLLKEGESLFVGTSDGLKILDLSTGKVITYSEDFMNPRSLSSNSIVDVFRDRQGNLWVCTDKGLNVAYRNKGFSTYIKYEDQPEKDFNIMALYKDDRNRMWLGYANGIVILDENHDPIALPAGIEKVLPSGNLGEIFCFYQDTKGNLWIGTYMNGLLKFDKKTNKLIQYYPGEGSRHLPGTDVRSVKEDSGGNLWIAIHGRGIYVKKSGSEDFHSLSEFDSDIPKVIDQPWTFELAFDQNDNLWVVSSLGCYYYNFATKNYHHFNQSESSLHFLSANKISSVFIDSKNNIWLGSKNGLNFLTADFSELKIFDQNKGLMNNEIQAINEDASQIIWVSTNNGIARLKPADNNEFIITNYDMNHGLNTNDFSLHSTYFAENKIMYFGGAFGYTYFNPGEIEIDSIPPSVVLTHLYIFDKKAEVQKGIKNKGKDVYYLNKHIRFTDQLRIQEKYSMIGFEFVALNFLNPDKNRYQYKLDGFDDEWRDLGTRNIVYFNSLRPGTYTFKVQGSNSYGIWNPEPAQVELKIIPPLWKSGYALIIYILLILAISFYLLNISIQKAEMRIQVEQQTKLRDLRTRFFMNVSHELKTPLTLISIPLKNIMKRYEEGTKNPSFDELHMIYRNVNRLIRIMNQLFDFRKIELNKVGVKVSRAGIVETTNQVIEFFEYQLRQKNMDLEKDFPDEETEFYFDRDKMDKIFYNLLSNAIKNSQEEGSVKIEIRRTKESKSGIINKDYARWVIEDNGPGIPESKINTIFERYSYTDSNSANDGGTGIGLSIVQEFVKLHHGEISIESQAKKDGFQNSFTRVTLEFPIDENLYSPDQFEEKEENKKAVYDNRWKTEFRDEELDTAVYSDEKHAENTAYSVLVIDDDKDICNLLRSELSANYHILTAFDGEEGLRKALKYLPDIIISDIMMPLKDGFELCRELKTKIATSHIPIILLTGKTTDEDELEGYSKGADAYISKPFELNKLISRIDSLISNRIQLKRTFFSSYGIELKKVVPSNTDEKFIQSFLKIIHGNISDHDLNVEIITRELGLSRSMLYKKLNSIANTSVNVFIRKVRLQRATELLKEGSMNITEVAYAVGFDSLPYFSKCFQEEYGVSPSKYCAKNVL